MLRRLRTMRETTKRRRWIDVDGVRRWVRARMESFVKVVERSKRAKCASLPGEVS